MVVLAPEHAVGLFDALDDHRVGTYIGGPDVTTLEALEDRIRRVAAGPPPGTGERWCNWVVMLGSRVIGRLEATLHDGIAEIAYVFSPSTWGHGYAAEAVRWLLIELRGARVAAVWATVDPENVASIGLLRRLGFQPSAAPREDLRSFDPGDEVYSVLLGRR